uniref:Uncharacterized protein n=1 Tax=Arundo donax TaxID=35708 RepID=A0A0A9HA14_ARUDO
MYKSPTMPASHTSPLRLKSPLELCPGPKWNCGSLNCTSSILSSVEETGAVSTCPSMLTRTTSEFPPSACCGKSSDSSNLP